MYSEQSEVYNRMIRILPKNQLKEGKEEGSRVTSVRIRCVYSNQINLQPTINTSILVYGIYLGSCNLISSPYRHT